MKIISKHRDYYDSVMAHGVDTMRTYMRTTYEIAADDKNKKAEALRPLYDMVLRIPYTERYRGKFPDEFYVKPFIIAFCGKAYFGIRVRNHLTSSWPGDPAKWTKFFFDPQSYRDWVNTEAPKSLRQTFQEKHGTHPWRERDYKDIRNDSVNEHFNIVDAFEDHKPFHEIGEPVILLDRSSRGDRYQCTLATMNPVLKDWGFVKVKDPFTAYQEIDMYLSGVIGAAHPPMIEVANDVRIAKHGFNDRSFRKEPGQKKRRKAR